MYVGKCYTPRNYNFPINQLISTYIHLQTSENCLFTLGIVSHTMISEDVDTKKTVSTEKAFECK